ncbi:MAG: 50S ribosomal protein L6 [Candidatus Jorgensenbacteria bacterium GW2011_GWA2_45_9]|uniref:50S ribosomal protein L6 n=2 Tax=Candidatus Joergenseniibacteriota TaxID=1752739 RepID=A0A0G1N5Q9_9BACT|nr:MAG: 50S ribosomal protein L6 [Candidatus Jorgensenbacteria bacterium GW2011_GWA2_45_9]
MVGINLKVNIHLYMSKIGKQIIEIPNGITASVTDFDIVLKSAAGEAKVKILDGVRPVLSGSSLSFETFRNSQQARSNWGTLKALTANAVIGLTKGFEKTLILEGVGFRIMEDGDGLTLHIGFSHPVLYPKTPGISFEIEKNSILKIKGTDKALVGKVAAEIRAMKKAEPYKGKGFRYSDEVVRRKAGKKSTTSASAS